MPIQSLPTDQESLLDVSVIIPTRNAAQHLPAVVAACKGAREIIVVDGGSGDGTPDKASQLGARLIATQPGRGHQLHMGAKTAGSAWLLFLHADTVLTGSWRQEVIHFISIPENTERAATFRFEVNDPSRQARRLERWVAWRVSALGLPYGDQGLLLHRSLYYVLGGFREMPLMEDVDLVRRIGRRRLTVFQSAARTSAERWQREGWIARSLRNLFCLSLYFLGVSPRRLLRLYG
jgi:rSAM/selenodomain-associated transferase 2